MDAIALAAHELHRVPVKLAVAFVPTNLPLASQGRGTGVNDPDTAENWRDFSAVFPPCVKGLRD